MNREEFLKYLESPGQLDKRSILEMHELLNEFPYFQTAHLMLLRNLYNLGNIKFDSQLKKSAAYIGNRSVLYYLLHRPGITAGEKQAETKPVHKTEEPVTEKIKEKSPGKIEPEIQVKKEKIKPEVSISKKTGEKKKPEQVDKQEKETLAYIILKRIEEIKKGQEGSKSGIIPASKEVIQEKKTDAAPPPVADKILNELAEKKKPEKKTESQVKDSKTNQILEIGNEDEIIKGINGEKEQFDADELKIMAGDDILLELDEENIEENLQVIGGERVKSDELINKFIINSPHILPRKEDTPYEEQLDISESSGSENEGFITETLAKIYINQGYYSKAIYAYEKLSLKFPEKSSYFATQIENIKKLIKKL